MWRGPAASLVLTRLGGPDAARARRLVAASVAATAVASGSMVAFLVVLAGAVATVVDGETGTLGGPIAAMAALVALRALALRSADGLAARGGELVQLAVRTCTVSALVEQAREGERSAPGVDATGGTSAIEGAAAVRTWVTDYLPAAAGVVITPVLVMAVVVVLDAPSALILLFTGPMLVLLLAVIGRRTAELARRREDELQWLRSLYEDLLEGIATLRTFGRSEHGEELVRSTSAGFADRTLEVLRTAFQSSLVMEWAATAATALVAVEVSFRLTADHLGFGAALAVLVVVPEFFAPFRSLALAHHAGSAGDAAAASIHSLLDGAPGAAGTSRQGQPWGSAPPELDLVGVTLRHPGAATPALGGLDLHVGAGRTLALCGPSGAGKSTAARILVGLANPDSGLVLRDGHRVDSTCDDRWRGGVAWVPQAPTLFAGTVADNIALGRPGASRTEVAHAARAAGADGFITKLADGYDTRLGEHGAGLSGGERQRVAIARALLRDAPLVVLDEFTSHLDPVAESELLDAMGTLASRSTTVVVAHREATARRADHLVVLDGGVVVDQGPPGEVLARRGWDSLVRPAQDVAEPGSDTARTAGTAPPGRTARTAPPARTMGRRASGDDDRPVPAVAMAPTAAAPAPVASTASLLGSLRGQWRWVAPTAVLSWATTMSGIGLIAVAAWLISRASELDSTASLGLGITVVRLFAVSRVGLRYAERLAGHVGTFRWLTEQRVRVYRRLEPLVARGERDLRRGDLLARVLADIDTLGDLPLRAVVPVLAGTVSLIATAALLWALTPAASVVAIAALVLAGCLVPWWATRSARSEAARSALLRGRLEADLGESLRGLDELVVLGGTGGMEDRVRRWASELGALERRAAVHQARARASSALALGLGVLGSLAVAVQAVRSDELAVVLLATVPLVVIAATEAVAPFGPAVVAAERARASLGRQVALGGSDRGAADAATADIAATTGTTPAIDARGLWFAHDRAADAPWVLRGVDLEVPGGATVLLDGPSGSGKSTLVSLLCGLGHADAGTVRVQGRDVAALGSGRLAALVAVVRQPDHLFDTSVRDNLAVADPDATDATMMEVLRSVGAREWIEAQPGGLGTRIGRDGAHLSGGERQRLLVARALLSDAPLLVLDEATTHLDARSEAAVVDAVRRWADSGHRTVLWVAHHRPTALREDLHLAMCGGVLGPGGPPARAAEDRPRSPRPGATGTQAR